MPAREWPGQDAVSGAIGPSGVGAGVSGRCVGFRNMLNSNVLWYSFGGHGG